MAFTWSTMASGIIGNAAYDSLKALLGNSFGRLTGYVANNQNAKFEETLEVLLESDETLRTQLTALASGMRVNITTGDITTNGNVIVGINNRMG